MHEIAKFQRNQPLPEQFLNAPGTVELQPGQKRTQRGRNSPRSSAAAIEPAFPFRVPVRSRRRPSAFASTISSLVKSVPNG